MLDDFSPKFNLENATKSGYSPNEIDKSEFDIKDLNEQDISKIVKDESSRLDVNNTVRCDEETIPTQVNPLCNEDVERKHFSEREITYNLLLRRLIDEFLDRTVTYSHQPKNIISALKSILERNFPEFGDIFHRERICAYLKACRRNAKKKNGEPFVRISARYLSAGQATRIADQIYAKEQEAIARIAALSAENEHRNPSCINNGSVDFTANRPNKSRVKSSVEMEEKLTARPMNYPDSAGQTQQAFTSLLPGSAERLFAGLLKQTAEFLLSVADRLDSGQSIFPIPGTSV